MIITPNTLIEELKENDYISVRTYNGLKYAGIDNVQKLLSYLAEGNLIINIKNLGKKSELELSKVREQISFTQNNPSHEATQFLLPEDIRDVFKESLCVFIDQNKDCSIQFVEEYKDNPGTLFVNFNAFNGEFSFQSSLSKQENLFYRQTYCDFIEYLIKELSLKGDLGKYIEKYYAILKNMKDNSSLSLCEELSYISQTCDEILQYEFNCLSKSCLSVRALNFISKKGIEYKMMVPLFNTSIQEYNNYLCPGQSCAKTLIEIQKLNVIFEDIFKGLYKLSDNELHLYQLKKKYPFLLGKQRLFVSSFEKEHGRIPCYMLLYNYLRYSDERSDKLYCLHYGMLDNRPKSVVELAELFSLTKERVRQIIYIEKPAAKSMFFCERSYLKSYPDIFRLNIITENTSVYEYIKESEALNISFGIFASLTAVFSAYSIENIKDRIVLISNRLNDEICIRNIIKKIENVLKGKYSKDTAISINSILTDIPNKYQTEVSDFLIWILNNVYNISVPESGEILFAQNCVDVELELISILEENGKAMYIQDLFNRFNQLYPDHKASDPDKIRPYLLKSSYIKAIGRQSLYGLDIWEDVFFGTIPDFLMNILNENELPIQLSTLFEKVVDNFPNTTIKSVASFMSSDLQERFVVFQDNYYGVKGKSYPDEYIKQPIIQRFKFEERISMFRDFVNTYHRYPTSTGGDMEGSLQRWYYNVFNGLLDITEEQKKEFDNLVTEYTLATIPQTDVENKFLINCIEYKEFLNRNHKLPSATNGEELYSWFYRAKSKYEGFYDQRYKYMLDLINYIQSYGFVI